MSTTSRFDVLDPLRFLAAMGVVFYHYSIYWAALNGTFFGGLCDLGYLGVNFFFMLSGFVIMASASGRSALGFAIARIKRLYPSFITCLLLTGGIVFFTTGHVIPVRLLLLNATMLNDYLHVPNVDGVYWTLQAEIKFYGCIFILILLGAVSAWRYWLPLWALFAIWFHFWQQPFFLGWFINPQYSFYFIAGVCCYLLHKEPANKLLLILFGGSLVFALMKAPIQIKDFIPHATLQQGYMAQAIIAAFFIFFFLLSKNAFSLVNAPKWWRYLGAISYPLYLLHNRAGKSLIDYFYNYSSIYVLSIAVILSLIGVCLLIHIYIERPISGWFK